MKFMDADTLFNKMRNIKFLVENEKLEYRHSYHLMK